MIRFFRFFAPQPKRQEREPIIHTEVPPAPVSDQELEETARLLQIDLIHMLLALGRQSREIRLALGRNTLKEKD
jgi:hypothetical protein